jgi:hypothetical protein
MFVVQEGAAHLGIHISSAYFLQHHAELLRTRWKTGMKGGDGARVLQQHALRRRV